MKGNENSWTAEAPSNIALIKYMGKREGNIPCNVSLSYTLDEFRTKVSLKLIQGECDEFINSSLSQYEKERFLKHLNFIKDTVNFRGAFAITSENSFPKSAGIASSASSFAALTMCAFKAISKLQGTTMPSQEFMSNVSRIGSGSSCRSFFSPWCIWDENGAKNIDIPIILEHQLVLVDATAKEVSSSEAHRIVQSSLLMKGRPERAQLRCKKLIDALKNDQWDSAFQICWEEFWDMHALFETCQSPFGYMLPKTLEILRNVRQFWKKNGNGPIATVDAGANVHLLWKKNAKKTAL